MTDIIARDTALRESAVMKIGVGYMLHRGVRRPILGAVRDGYGAPVMLDGRVMIPTAAILGTLGMDIPEGAETVPSPTGRAENIPVCLLTPLRVPTDLRCPMTIWALSQ